MYLGSLGRIESKVEIKDCPMEGFRRSALIKEAEEQQYTEHPTHFDFGSFGFELTLCLLRIVSYVFELLKKRTRNTAFCKTLLNPTIA